MFNYSLKIVMQNVLNFVPLRCNEALFLFMQDCVAYRKSLVAKSLSIKLKYFISCLFSISNEMYNDSQRAWSVVYVAQLDELLPSTPH